MPTSFDPGAGLKALLMLCCAFAAAAASASPPSLRQAQDPRSCAMQNARCPYHRSPLSSKENRDERSIN